MPLIRTADPAGPAVPMIELLEYLRVSSSDDQLVIAGMLSAATGWVEQWTERALITQGWRLVLDEWPRDGIVPIDRTPVQAVMSVSYADPSGVTQSLQPDDWELDSSNAPARLAPAPGKTWPHTAKRLAAISIDFTAGFGPSWNDVPETIRQAIFRLTAHFYDNRDTASISGSGGSVTDLPFHVKALLAPYRAWRHR